MTFLAPSLLVLGLAVAVPLALHLLQRHQGPRVVFPALRYLRRAEREHAARLRLRQVLLLALRVLALLLLAAAAARPFLPAGGGGHHPTSVVIILDNSLSSAAVVGDRRVLDPLKDAALATLAAAGPDDRLWLIRAGEPWEPALTGSPDVLATALRGIDPAATAADLAAQVERAASILAAEADGRAAEIHLLSDLAAGSFRPGRAASGGARVFVLEPPAAPERNRAVTAVEVGGGLPPLSGDGSTVTATVRGFGRGGEAGPEVDVPEVDVRLVLAGQVVSAARGSIGAVATLSLPPHGPGIVAGRVEIDPDALATDDRRYFVTEIRRPPAVRIGAPAPFIEQAMAVLEEAGRARPWTAGTDGVVIAPGAAGVDAVHGGAGVIALPPASPLELGAANQRLASAGIPWRFGRPGAEETRLRAEGTGLDAVLEGVRLRQVHPLESVGEARDTVLLRLRTGEPWAVAGRTDTGRYVILATPLTPEAGTVPTSAAMLPLLDRAVNAWLAGGMVHREHHPGSVITLPAGDSIVRPDAGADPVRVGSPYRLTRPGIYRVLAGGSTTAAFAVNAPAEASDVRPVRASDLPALLAGHDVRTVSARSWSDAVYHRRLGRDIVMPLLFAAALVLLLEARLAASGRGLRRRPDTAEPTIDAAALSGSAG